MHKKTKESITLLLRRISTIGDTYEQHKEDLDYKSFLEMQLELIKRITETERRIQKLKKEDPNDPHKIQKAQETRMLLKLLGTTIAWILLEFDRPYIRNFARGHDSGFLFGKKGLELERLVLKAAFKGKNSAAILHDITNCLRIGDLTVIGPRGFSTLELKQSARKKKFDRRGLRQKRRGENAKEFYDRKISTKIHSGYRAVAHSFKKIDKHNWKQACAVIAEADKKGHGIRIVEECLVYFAFKDEVPNEVFSYLKSLRDTHIMFGCQDKHILGIPTIMPFTCFDIPLSYKEKLLFGEINFCVLLDLNSLCRILEKNGFKCRVLKDLEVRIFGSIIEIFDKTHKNLGYGTITYGMISRLLYECLSIRTFVDYARNGASKISEMLELDP